MGIPYYHVDAFTTGPFSGNPAGVCLLEANWPPDAFMQLIAAENNLSETAFILPRDDGSFDLRWFAPGCEVDLCGHATLAAAHVLFRHLAHNGPDLLFHTKAGPLGVSLSGDILTLDFPTRAGIPCEPLQDLIKGLGRSPAATFKARDYLAIFDDESTVRDLRPEDTALSRLDCLGVIATAPGKDCDFVSRFFAPRAGVPEDPVTGSAHCTLIPYWAGRLGKQKLHARQVSVRGGELFCAHLGERVTIGGGAVTYATGTLHVG